MLLVWLVFVSVFVEASIMFALLTTPNQLPIMVRFKIGDVVVMGGFQFTANRPIARPAAIGCERQERDGAAPGHLIRWCQRWRLHCGGRQVAHGGICVQSDFADFQQQRRAAPQLQRGEDQKRAGQGQNEGQKQGQNVRRVALIHTQKIPLIQHFHLIENGKWTHLEKGL